MSREARWLQVNVQGPRADSDADTSLVRMGQIMSEAEARGLITGWFFIRKGTWRRWRYQPVRPHKAEPRAVVREKTERLRQEGVITQWVEPVYEPESYAFGGTPAMKVAHELFHGDSRAILEYALTADGTFVPDWGVHNKELSILLCAVLMRGARQEWFEQGDVWAKVSEVRAQSTYNFREGVVEGMRRLLTVDASHIMARRGISHWCSLFEQAGRSMVSLSESGLLGRGIRLVLAHHVIFHWNRMGIPHQVQCTLAAAATKAILG
jgi:thiopeptide-type bacteriocin biosynthesis protein